MAIRKNAPNYLKKTKQPFTTLLNKTLDLIPDAAALGIYVYLSSKQNDWIIQEKDLMSRFGSGRDFIRARMKILKDLGLLIKESVRDEKGKIIHWETILLNEVGENPHSQQNIQITEKPPSGKPRYLDNPTYINKRYNEINNNNINISTSGEAHDLDYNFSDEEINENKKSDYLNNHEQDKNDIPIDLIQKGNDTKSDYFDNQSKIKSSGKIRSQYCIKNILEDNFFQIPEQIIHDWIENRKKKRAPVTATAWKKVNKELTKCKEQGIDPVEAFETTVASGWQSLKVEYFLTKEFITKQEEAKKRSIELEQMAARRKQKEIDDAKRLRQMASKASEYERSKLRKKLGLKNPGVGHAYS